MHCVHSWCPQRPRADIKYGCTLLCGSWELNLDREGAARTLNHCDTSPASWNFFRVSRQGLKSFERHGERGASPLPHLRPTRYFWKVRGDRCQGLSGSAWSKGKQRSPKTPSFSKRNLPQCYQQGATRYVGDISNNTRINRSP